MRYFNLHTHQATGNLDVVEMINQYPKDFENKYPYFSIGIHPWYIEENTIKGDLSIIESHLQDKNCLAIGECGLDKKIEVSFQLQVEVLEAQLLLAQKYHKPVIIHCVAAFSELILSKKRLKVDVPIIIHGFSKNAATAKQLIDHGFYLSFGKSFLFNPKMTDVMLSVPESRIFLETDALDEGISGLYHRVAVSKNSTIADIKQMIATNVTTVFNVSL